MSHRIPDTDWVRAVLRHNEATRHLHIDVMEADGGVCLEGRVPTRVDRQRAGSVARSAATPGLSIINHLFVVEDLANTSPSRSREVHSQAPRWQAMYQQSVAAMAASAA
jgi:osmotically-inducible protein OsmY